MLDASRAELLLMLVADTGTRMVHRGRRAAAEHLYTLAGRIDQLGETIDPHGDARARRRQLVIDRYGDHLVEPAIAAPWHARTDTLT